MKKHIGILMFCCVTLFLLSGCTKEKALAMQAASLKLVVATEKAVLNVKEWWSASNPSVSDLTGDTIDEKVGEIASSIASGATSTSRQSLLDEAEKIKVQLSKKSTLKRISILIEGANQINQSLADLEKGSLFASKAVKNLKPHLINLFSSLVNLSETLSEIPVTEKFTDLEILEITKITKDNSKSDEVKKLEIARQLRRLVEKKQDYQGLKNKMTASLALAAKYSMDIIIKIDDYEKLSLKDILDITSEWGPLAVKLSGGKISQTDVDKVKNEVKTYAEKIGVLEVNIPMPPQPIQIDG